jgi:hypothetical protein
MIVLALKILVKIVSERASGDNTCFTTMPPRLWPTRIMGSEVVSYVVWSTNPFLWGR